MEKYGIYIDLDDPNPVTFIIRGFIDMLMIPFLMFFALLGIEIDLSF